MFSPKPSQLAAFEHQVQLACRLQAPLFLHERDHETNPLGSHRDLLAILDTHGVDSARVCVHCFTSSDEGQLREYVRRGYMIGITGFVCKKKRGASLRAFLRNDTLPLAQCLLETDSPFMQPDGWPPNTPNEPSSIPVIARVVAACLGVPVATVIAVTTENAHRFFKLHLE